MEEGSLSSDVNFGKFNLKNNVGLFLTIKLIGIPLKKEQLTGAKVAFFAIPPSSKYPLPHDHAHLLDENRDQNSDR